MAQTARDLSSEKGHGGEVRRNTISENYCFVRGNFWLLGRIANGNRGVAKQYPAWVYILGSLTFSSQYTQCTLDSYFPPCYKNYITGTCFEFCTLTFLHPRLVMYHENDGFISRLREAKR